jgi:hypothetical protein
MPFAIYLGAAGDAARQTLADVAPRWRIRQWQVKAGKVLMLCFDPEDFRGENA